MWRLLGLPFTNPATAAEAARMAEHLRGWLAQRLASSPSTPAAAINR